MTAGELAATPVLPAPRWQLAGFWLALLGIVAVAAGLRFSSQQFEYLQPDEIITLRVSEHLLADRTLDANWKDADLPASFRYPQYNFSGYMLFSAGALAVSGPGTAHGEVPVLKALRWWSALLGVVVVVQAFAVTRLLFGPLAGLLAAAFSAVAVLLYQDSLYARPESFVTALTLLYVQVLLMPGRRRVARLLLASTLLGILAGTKISMLALAPLLLLEGRRPGSPAAWNDWLREEWRLRRPVLLAAMKWAPCGFAAGFLLAAPYTLVHPADFLSGLEALATQYVGGHPPHGLADGTATERLAYALRYFGATLGWPLLLAGCAGVVACWRRKDADALLLFGVVAATAWRFASFPTFFERNFSHLLPVAFAFSAAGISACAGLLGTSSATRGAVTLLLAAAAALPALSTTASLRFRVLSGSDAASLNLQRRQVVQRTGVPMKLLGEVTADDGSLQQRIAPCGPELIELKHAGDAPGEAAVRRLVATQGFEVVGDFPSAFEGVPPSTLQTYHSPHRVMLLRQGDGPACADSPQ